MTEKKTYREILESEVKEILETEVHQVSTNSGNSTISRFYTEDESEKNWTHEHHLIDLDDQGLLYSSLIIIGCALDGATKMVRLSCNEVDELLSILLRWRLENANKYAVKPVEDNPLSDLDDHPF